MKTMFNLNFTTMMININNFDDTIVKTLKTAENVKTLQTFYLDKHILKGCVYYTISADEVILLCFVGYQKKAAEKNFEKLTQANCIISES